MAQISATKKFICIKTTSREEEGVLLNKVGGAKWSRKWSCWTMTNSPRNAYYLIRDLKNFITSCDPKVKEDAIAYHYAKESKHESKPPIPNLTIKSWEHQSMCYAFVSPLAGGMATMEMGCGKTLDALGFVENYPHETILTVCPKKVQQVWPPAIAKFCTTEFLICTPKGKSVEDRTTYTKKQYEIATIKKIPFWLILNYEAMWREPMASFLQKATWNIILYDEIHKIKSASGVASRFAAKLVKNSNKRFGLTGTPLPHGPEDLFAQYRALDPSVFGDSYTAFKAKYIEYGGYGGKEIIGYKNMEDFHERMESISFRVTADVLGLPPTVDTPIQVFLEPKTVEIYNKLEKELYVQLEQGEVTAQNALVKLLKLQQLTAGFLATDEKNIVTVDNSKVETLCELVEDLPTGEPFVVFCRFIPEVAAIRAALLARNIKSNEVSGKCDELIRWQNGETPGLVVNIQAGEAGLDFTRAAYVFYNSKGFNMGHYDQSRKRADRPGQTRNVRYYHLVVPNTVDMRVERALAERREIVSFVIDGIKKNKFGHAKCKPNEGGIMTREEALAMYGF